MTGLGIFDVDKNHPYPLGHIEYRWTALHFRPLMALSAATKGNSFICAGVAYDLHLGSHSVLTPSFAPGLYYHGKGKQLGFPLNFRSALELAFVCKNKARWGAQLNHLSNAHILFKNPGANSLCLFYAFPLTSKKASGK